MTLRLRLLAVLAALAGLLAVGEWALVRKLSADLERELASAAAAVSRDVLRVLRVDAAHAPGALPTSSPAPGAPGDGKRLQRHLVVTRPDGTTETTTELVEEDTTITAAATAVADAETTVEMRAGAPARGAGPQLERLPLPEDVRLLLAARHPSEVVVVHGSVERRLPIPTAGVEAAVGRFGQRLLLGSLALVGGALLLAGVLVHRFTRPLRELAQAARRLGEGDLGVGAPAAPGEVGEAIAAFNQMSRRLATLDAETRRLRQSEQLSELGEVGRGLAHSLRNPLNALGLAVDQLADRAADADSAAVAAAARRQIGRVDAALRGFLALAAGGAAAAEVDVVAVARDVALEALQTRPAGAAGGGVGVEVSAGDGPLRLTGVEAEVRAAVQALVVNAVEASPPGESVAVSVCRDDGAVVVAVADRGPGLAPEVRSRLFQPHVTTKAAGAGVGLYLAHRLATGRYGGSLALADRDGGGTCATLRLRDRGDVAAEDPRGG